MFWEEFPCNYTFLCTGDFSFFKQKTFSLQIVLYLNMPTTNCLGFWVLLSWIFFLTHMNHHSAGLGHLHSTFLFLCPHLPGMGTWPFTRVNFQPLYTLCLGLFSQYLLWAIQCYTFQTILPVLGKYIFYKYI